MKGEEGIIERVLRRLEKLQVHEGYVRYYLKRHTTEFLNTDGTFTENTFRVLKKKYEKKTLWHPQFL